MLTRLVLGAAVLGVPFAGGRAGDSKPPVDLTLAKATAEQLGNDVLVICDVVLDNQTGKALNVRSTFSSAFDGLMVVVRDENGKLLLQQPYVWHQSPFAPPGRDFPLRPGENRGELRFPVKLPKDVTKVRVMLVGTLPGSGFDEILTTDVIAVTVTKK